MDNGEEYLPGVFNPRATAAFSSVVGWLEKKLSKYVPYESDVFKLSSSKRTQSDLQLPDGDETDCEHKQSNYKKNCSEEVGEPLRVSNCNQV